ncbi:MAG TPA: phospholipid carrier-dependent glycosyltransferase [Candidatus Paceibacterota bacterium]|nr:phospholipid carrier-dependent glycosyltransferase [Candidatus Paceibacterota bacterium]
MSVKTNKKTKKIIDFLQKEWVLIMILLVLASATRFLYLGHPKEMVFDEVYFAKWVTNYYNGQFYFDIHPPLAKMMLAASAKIFGYGDAGNTDFSKIGNAYQTDYYKFLRGMEGLFGVILVLAVYALGKKMFKNKWPGFLAGLLIVFDNAILVQSRFIFTDVFLLAFGVIGLYFIYRLKEHQRLNSDAFVDLFFAALFLAASILIKWTALIFVGVGIVVLFIDVLQNKKKDFIFFIKEATAIAGIILVVYLGIFAAHLMSLPYSGGQDDNFLSPRFQSTLLGNVNYGKYETPNLFERIVNLNVTMFAANASITKSHPYESKWYTWPIMWRSIFDWEKRLDNGQVERIYLLGNPLIWWMGLLSVVFVFITLFSEFRSKKKTIYFESLLVLAIGYLFNLLPYIFISRPAFLYHYFPSFIFMSLMMGFVLWFFLKEKPIVLIVIFIIIATSFVYFAPISYGLPMSEERFNDRMWLASWR